jgi:hypothetical protein
MREQQEEWMELCRQASVEQDREKLFRLVCRINELLEAKGKRLRSGAAEPPNLMACESFGLPTMRCCLLAERNY